MPTEPVCAMPHLPRILAHTLRHSLRHLTRRCHDCTARQETTP